MTSADLDLAIGWAAAEGWNPGLADAEAFLAADPAGFLMGFVDDEPVGCISVVRYSDSFAFLGLYIVSPSFRGRGHGIAIWRAGIAHAAGRDIGLDGVVAQQGAYRRSGFSLAHRNIRYASTVTPSEPVSPRVVPLDQVPLDWLAAYDRQHFPAARPDFVSAWAKPPRRGFAMVRDGDLHGYGVVRACRSGSKIGPLFADTPDDAEQVFAALAAAIPAQPLFLDVPEPNAEARAMAERNGMAPVFETARMYTGPDPGLPLQRIYGITTLELG